MIAAEEEIKKLPEENIQSGYKDFGGISKKYSPISFT